MRRRSALALVCAATTLVLGIPSFVLAYFVHRADVGTVEDRGSLGLAEEAGSGIRIR